MMARGYEVRLEEYTEALSGCERGSAAALLTIVDGRHVLLPDAVAINLFSEIGLNWLFAKRRPSRLSGVFATGELASSNETDAPATPEDEGATEVSARRGEPAPAAAAGGSLSSLLDRASAIRLA